MGPKKGKKKSVIKKIVTGTMEETVGGSLMQKMGLKNTTDGSEYGSEYYDTPRDGDDNLSQS